jgi:hypothetical protein
MPVLRDFPAHILARSCCGSVYLCSAPAHVYLALGMTISGLATSGALIRILQQGQGRKECQYQRHGTVNGLRAAYSLVVAGTEEQR